MGCRATVALRGGGALRVALPFAPARPLPGLALAALAEALPPAAWQELHARYLACPGAPRVNAVALHSMSWAALHTCCAPCEEAATLG